MKSSNKEVTINHNAKQLFDIVLDLEKYPEFIPWCTDMKIHSKKTNETYVWRSLFLHACFVIKTKTSVFAKTVIFLGHWFIPGEASSVRQKDTTETLKDAGYYLSLPFWSSVECTDSHFFTPKSP